MRRVKEEPIKVAVLYEWLVGSFQAMISLPGRVMKSRGRLPDKTVIPTLDLPDLLTPRISIVIPNYNYASYLAQAIESVLAQTYKAFEVIVVDDGSTDESLDIIRTFEERGVRLITQENGGQVTAYNIGHSQTSGDVTLFLDSDDALLPDALESIARKFTKGVAKVHFRLHLIDQNGDLLGSYIPHELARGEVATDFIKHGVPHASPPASGNAYRRSVLDRLFPLPSDAIDRHGADFFCIYGSTLLGTVAACSETLGLYRIHNLGDARTNITFGNAEKGFTLHDRVQFRYERFLGWIKERIQPSLTMRSELLDFSVLKSDFATAVLDAKLRRTGLLVGIRRLPTIYRSIVIRNDYGRRKKIALIAWAVLVVGAPRSIARRAARYVCDPGAR